MNEIAFRAQLALAIGAQPGFRVWVQNVGTVPVRDASGDTRYFHTGIPTGASDLSGIVMPEGWRIEFELKGPKTKHTTEQKAWAAAMRRFGCVVAFYRYCEQLTLEENNAAALSALLGAIEDRRAP